MYFDFIYIESNLKNVCIWLFFPSSVSFIIPLKKGIMFFILILSNFKTDRIKWDFFINSFSSFCFQHDDGYPRSTLKYWFGCLSEKNYSSSSNNLTGLDAANLEWIPRSSAAQVGLDVLLVISTVISMYCDMFKS